MNRTLLTCLLLIFKLTVFSQLKTGSGLYIGSVTGVNRVFTSEKPGLVVGFRQSFFQFNQLLSFNLGFEKSDAYFKTDLFQRDKGTPVLVNARASFKSITFPLSIAANIEMGEDLFFMAELGISVARSKVHYSGTTSNFGQLDSTSKPYNFTIDEWRENPVIMAIGISYQKFDFKPYLSVNYRDSGNVIDTREFNYNTLRFILGLTYSRSHIGKRFNLPSVEIN